MDDLIRLHRRWLKDSIRKTVDWSSTDQSLGIHPPPPQKPVPPGALPIALPGTDRFEAICDVGLLPILKTRRSLRRYADIPISLSRFRQQDCVAVGVADDRWRDKARLV